VKLYSPTAENPNLRIRNKTTKLFLSSWEPVHSGFLLDSHRMTGEWFVISKYLPESVLTLAGHIKDKCFYVGQRLCYRVRV